MTYFPGASYQTYFYRAFTYPRRRRPARLDLGGATRYIEDIPPDLLKMAQLTPHWKEYVHIIGDGTADIYYRDGRRDVAGVWDFNVGDLEELIRLTQEYKKIFIHVHGTARNITNMWKARYYKHARYMWELQSLFRDKVDMIIYGLFDYEMYYCMGLSGGGAAAGKFYEYEIVLPDGRGAARGNGFDPGIWKIVMEKVGKKSNLATSIAVWLKVPEFNRDFYKRRFESPKDSLLESKKLTKADVANFYFCRNYRDIGADPFNRSQHVKKGINSLRPDQHRFLAGDGVICSHCSLSYCCRFYRKNGVCVVADTDGRDFVDKFKSDKVEDILSGMQDLLGEEAYFLRESIDRNKKLIAKGEKPDKGLGKEINQMLTNAASFAKLKDPSLTKPKVQVNVNQPQLPTGGNYIDGEVVVDVPAIEAMSDRDKSAIIRDMVKAGWNRASITRDDMVEFINSNKELDSKAF